MLAGIDNERIREILPLLRPRSAEPTVFNQTVLYLLCIGLVLIVFFYAKRRYRHWREEESQFRQLGREHGLKSRQIEFLRKAGRRRRLKSPRRLLTSASSFERHIGDYATDLAAKDLDHPDLKRIAEIREALGFDELPPAQALTSTRQVEKGQTFLIWEETDHKEGFAPWIVVDRHEAALTVSPLLKADDHLGDQRAALRTGDEVSVRFWREGDTEYRFHTRVLDIGGESSVLLRHTGEVERLQQRDFVRVHVDFPVTLYLLDEETANQDDVHSEQAAVAMLDGGGSADGESDTGGEDPSSDGGWEALDDGDPSADGDQVGDRGLADEHQLDAAPQIQGQVVNISAGGMGVLLREPLPNTKRWLVAPDFRGTFPLAGILCTVVGDQKSRGDATLVKLKFDKLTSAAERDIVKQVYEHQILEVSGIGPRGHAAFPERPPED